MKSKEIIKSVMNLDKDKIYPSSTYEEDYAGGSRMYLREDLVEEAMLYTEIVSQIDVLKRYAPKCKKITQLQNQLAQLKA